MALCMAAQANGNRPLPRPGSPQPGSWTHPFNEPARDSNDIRESPVDSMRGPGTAMRMWVASGCGRARPWALRFCTSQAPMCRLCRWPVNLTLDGQAQGSTVTGLVVRAHAYVWCSHASAWGSSRDVGTGRSLTPTPSLALTAGLIMKWAHRLTEEKLLNACTWDSPNGLRSQNEDRRNDQTRFLFILFGERNNTLLN